MRLASAPNFRDLGGQRTTDGRLVRRGLVFRSEAVLDPDAREQAQLRDAGIVLVCDLRGEMERAHAPNRWWAGEGVERLDLDIMADIRGAAQSWALLETDRGAEGGRALMRSIYRQMPAAAGGHLATVFARIAAGDVPLLIHCTAGKDRTGFMSAMMLHALGVAYEIILADYLASAGVGNEQVRAATRRIVKTHAPNASEAAIAAIRGVEESYLDASFAAMTEDYGSADDYLKDVAGLDSAMRARVRDRMLEHAPPP